MYMCLYILYVCRPLNLLKHTKFRQYRIPVISIASTKFFKHVIFYSTMFFPIVWWLDVSIITTSLVARNVFEGLRVLFIFRATYHPWHTTGGEDWTPLFRCAVLAAKHLKFCPGFWWGHFRPGNGPNVRFNRFETKILEAEFHIEVVPIHCWGQFHCPPLKYPAHLSNLCPAVFLLLPPFLEYSHKEILIAFSKSNTIYLGGVVVPGT